MLLFTLAAALAADPEWTWIRAERQAELRGVQALINLPAAEATSQAIGALRDAPAWKLPDLLRQAAWVVRRVHGDPNDPCLALLGDGPVTQLMVYRHPAKCEAIGGAALWPEPVDVFATTGFPALDARGRREAVVAWMRTRPGGPWAGEAALAGADWADLALGQLAADTLLGVEGLTSRQRRGITAALASASEAIAARPDGPTRRQLAAVASMIASATPSQRVTILLGGVGETLAQAGVDQPCGLALHRLASLSQTAAVSAVPQLLRCPTGPMPAGAVPWGGLATREQRDRLGGDPFGLPDDPEVTLARWFAAKMAWTILDASTPWELVPDFDRVGVLATLRGALTAP